jgi:hypothetical protein
MQAIGDRRPPLAWADHPRQAVNPWQGRTLATLRKIWDQVELIID